MTPSTGAPHTPGTLAFVESPVQLLNVLEWAHAQATAQDAPRPTGQASPRPAAPAVSRAAAEPFDMADLTVVVLSPRDPMSRGQLRRMAELARGEGCAVRWEDAREGAGAPLRTVAGLAPALRRAGTVVIGDPFSRYVQLLLTLVKAPHLVVVDDGTATMEFAGQLARGERLVRWHRRGTGGGARELLLAPVTTSARRRLAPGPRRTVELFTAMPLTEALPGITVTANELAWTRSRFGPPRLTRTADLVGTSLVETGVVDLEHYIGAVRSLTLDHGATRYFAHRRENTDKLHRLARETGLEIVRPDLPLELIARRGPIGRTILSFPSTVVHTLPRALVGTDVRVAVCDVDPGWLAADASPRARGFLAGVSQTARDVRKLRVLPVT
ncbi:hypothetical protein [Streptomyces cremeus]|uniref:Uncharacterized protein n=1 Tax=Streptomyces cremeus TaxID=66881 RepID=A0ABV5PFS8_STRCM